MYKITLSKFWKSDKLLAIYCKTNKQGERLFKIMIDKGFCCFVGKNANYTNYGECILNDKDCKLVKINKAGRVWAKRYAYKIYNFNDVDLNN